MLAPGMGMPLVASYHCAKGQYWACTLSRGATHIPTLFAIATFQLSPLVLFPNDLVISVSYAAIAIGVDLEAFHRVNHPARHNNEQYEEKAMRRKFNGTHPNFDFSNARLLPASRGIARLTTSTGEPSPTGPLAR